MMTRTQKSTILEMRAEGIPYKAIAEQMGMSLGSVKMFVSRHKRRITKEQYKRLTALNLTTFAPRLTTMLAGN